MPGSRGLLVARTAADTRDVLVEGDSGLLKVGHPRDRCKYEPSKRRVVWPNGSQATLFCAVDDTEALTPQGWVQHSELRLGDLVRTLDTTTGLARWSPVEGVHAFEVTDHPMISIDMQMHRSLVTLDHRWPTRHKETQRIRWKESLLDFNSKDGVIIAAPSAEESLPEASIYRDEYVELVAWLTTEGYVRRWDERGSAGKLRRTEATVVQSHVVNPEKVEQIRLCLKRLWGAGGQFRGVVGPTWREDQYGRNTIFNLNHDAVLAMAPSFSDVPTKTVSLDFINALTAAQRDLFLSTVIAADGVWRPGGKSAEITQTVDARLDAIEYAAVLTGWGVRRGSRQIYGERHGYLTFSKSQRGDVVYPINHGKDHREHVRYTGTVWCPTTRDKTWLARYRGTVWYTGNTAEEPEVLRGPQGHWALCDEIATWRPIPDSAGLTAWDHVRVATRLRFFTKRGRIRPQVLALTTPKRTPQMKSLLKLSEEDASVILRHDTTRANAGNLDPQYLSTIYGLFKGTRMETQELEGRMLEDVEGALWTQQTLDDDRIEHLPYTQLVFVIAVDPSVAEEPTDECGIVVCASTTEQDLYKRKFFVVEDASILGSPNIWAQRVVDKAREYGCPVVAEVNQGGALVRNALVNIDPTVKVLDVRARYGKQTRAEPVSLAFEQHRGHMYGWWPELEAQLTSWTPSDRKSPDRLDAMVWGATALLIKPPDGLYMGPIRARSHAALRIPPRKPPRMVPTRRRLGVSQRQLPGGWPGR